MSLIRLIIDTKSLYFNIKNDNERGHTATVATPLKQGNSVRQELYEIEKIPENIDYFSKELLVSKILEKSRAAAKINRVCVFDKIAVNGIPIAGLPSFCIYVREEIDPNNVHFGRQKLHYPMSMSFEDIDIEINNKAVLTAISTFLHDYAFIVDAFEYETETGLFNFNVTIVGEPNIPYSKVFINRRGVGNKFSLCFQNNTDVYDTEIISLREKFGYENVSPDNFNEIMANNDAIARKIATDYLQKNGAHNVRMLKDEYPYAIYDIEYKVGDQKRYLIIKHTSTKLKYFSLTLAIIRFCNDFSDFADLLLITEINDAPQLHIYTAHQLNGLSKSINSITYEDR